MLSLKASPTFGKEARINVAVCLVFGRSTSHFESPFSPSVLAALCMCEEAEGWRNWGRNESRSFEVLFSSQAKQQAYFYPPWTVEESCIWLAQCSNSERSCALDLYLLFSVTSAMLAAQREATLHWVLICGDINKSFLVIFFILSVCCQGQLPYV